MKHKLIKIKGGSMNEYEKFKSWAGHAGRSTDRNIADIAFPDQPIMLRSRGQSAALTEFPDFIIAHVNEGLGTKILVADQMPAELAKGYLPYVHYRLIAQDAAATLLNDLATCGARPFSMQMHLEVSDVGWFDNKEKVHNLIWGWKDKCFEDECRWDGGQTSVAKGIVMPGAATLTGSVVGLIADKSLLLSQNKLRPGDAIVIFESNGLHANGFTKVREIVESLPEGYLTKIGEKTLGQLLLEPTPLYGPVIRGINGRLAEIHYAANITGGGWRKIMRADEPYRYVIETLPRPQKVFEALQNFGKVSDKEDYETWNMGAGFVLFMALFEAQRLVEYVNKSAFGFQAVLAGYVEPSDKKEVFIKPLGITLD